MMIRQRLYREQNTIQVFSIASAVFFIGLTIVIVALVEASVQMKRDRWVDFNSRSGYWTFEYQSSPKNTNVKQNEMDKSSPEVHHFELANEIWDDDYLRRRLMVKRLLTELIATAASIHDMNKVFEEARIAVNRESYCLHKLTRHSDAVLALRQSPRSRWLYHASYAGEFDRYTMLRQQERRVPSCALGSTGVSFVLTAIIPSNVDNVKYHQILDNSNSKSEATLAVYDCFGRELACCADPEGDPGSCFIDVSGIFLSTPGLAYHVVVKANRGDERRGMFEVNYAAQRIQSGIDFHLSENAITYDK